MRIVAGEFGGRRLAMPKDARVRPTADRVREAWMSILGDELPGARVLDLFAGSGALGLEALSRGAAHRPTSWSSIRRRSRPSRPTSTALGVAGRAHGAPGRRASASPSGSRPAPSTSPSPTRRTAMDDAERLVALFRRTPFARILSVEHRADRCAGRGRDPPLRRHRPHLLPRPMTASRSTPARSIRRRRATRT